MNASYRGPREAGLAIWPVVLLSFASLAAAAESEPVKVAAAPAEAAARASGEPVPAEPAPAVATAEPVASPTEPAPAPVSTPAALRYSLPFQLRPAMAGSVVRIDNVLALYQGTTGAMGNTWVTTALASYKLGPVAPMVRVGVVHNTPPGVQQGTSAEAVSFMNPVIGATFGIKPAETLNVGLFLGAALPLGTGWVASPQRTANAAGILARSAMDNAMFAVNYLTFFPGVSLAFVSKGFTAQIEATLLLLSRVRGSDVDPDAFRANFTSGVHAGYFVLPWLSLATEVRYQRWIVNSTFTATAAGRDNLTAAIGPRVHFQLFKTLWTRAALVYARGLDVPMSTSAYNLVQLDLAFPF
jgi:hypothetical protein